MHISQTKIATGSELLKTNSAILSSEVNQICQTG